MKRTALALSIAALLLTATACGDDSEPEAQTVERTAEDDGSEVVLRAGDELVITLDQCVGCGYTWQVIGDLDPDVLELTSAEDAELEEREPGMVGGETTHVMTFTAQAVGEGTLAIGYVPPGDGAPEDVLTYEVRVRD